MKTPLLDQDYNAQLNSSNQEGTVDINLGRKNNFLKMNFSNSA